MKKKTTKAIALAGLLTLSVGMVGTLAGCGGTAAETESTTAPATSTADTQTTEPASIEDKKIVYGTAAYSGASSESGIDPAYSYNSWSPVRYGICENLVAFSEDMAVQPFLAKSYEQTDAKTWVFTLNDGITFQNGNPCDAAAVKASLERVIELSDRTADVKNMLIDTITADGNTLTITTTEENPILPNLLCDPLWCIVDASEEIDGRTKLIGTGPYQLVAATEEGCTVKAYMGYWNGTPKVGTIEVKNITDGDTLTMALQNKEIDIAQELPLPSLALFQNDQYTISTNATSRSSNMVLNTAGKYLGDKNVRLAVAHALNKQAFIDSGLMCGYGQMAKGFFPDDFAGFGDTHLTAPEYDTAKAKELLADAGWTDTDGDGYVDKNGENMVLRLFTYTSRQDLPKLAEAFQANLKEVGIGLDIDMSEGADSESLRKKGADNWDINLWQMVTAPNGDPMYMIDSCLGEGGYYTSPTLEDPEMQAKIDQLRDETDLDKRYQLAIEIQQHAIDEGYILIAFHKEQSLAMVKEVTGIQQFPTDQREVTVDIDIS